MMRRFNGVQVFSATMVEQRQHLGEKVTDWLARHPSCEIADITVTQSSDASFHCIALVVFFFDAQAVPTRTSDDGSKSIRAARRLH
jgi:hypothetical protein